MQPDQVDDKILEQYSLLEMKGKGAYGVVWKALQKKTNKVVALKKIYDAFNNDTDAQRTFREIMYLRQLSDHENIIKLHNVHRATNNKDIYLTFDFMETDLHKVIRGKLLSERHIQYIIYQLLKALKYIHSGELIHRDLKPSNILIDGDCKIKVADFGLARSVDAFKEIPYLTEYVATRWYRAPEILMGSHQYNKAIDMWSVGCVLAEMFSGKPIFTGTSSIDQIGKIIELLGPPKIDDLVSIGCEIGDQIVEQINGKKRLTFQQVFRTSDEAVLDFLRNLLRWDPKKRMNVDQALGHPYIKIFRGSESEPIFGRSIESGFGENDKQSIKKYRDILYAMDKPIQPPSNIDQLVISIKRVKTQPSQQPAISPYIRQRPKLSKNIQNRFHSQDKIKDEHVIRERVRSEYASKANVKPIENANLKQLHVSQDLNQILKVYMKPKKSIELKRRSRYSFIDQKKQMLKHYHEASSFLAAEG